ncbi:hypothetical protein Tco_0227047 [Tanacetum coccineum]
MNSVGELTFFLGLQVKQQPDGIFISQDRYVPDILKKFDFWSIRTATTPIESNKPRVKDEDGVDVDVVVYKSMIGSLMYLTASRPDIMFDVCACARFQVTPKASHLNAVKRIFRYLKHQPKLGLWYPKDSPFELEPFLDSDYRGASLDRKSTTATIEGRQDDLLYSLFGMLCEQTDLDDGDAFMELFGSIYYALTVSPIVSTSFVEQFWTIAKSRTVNNISYIDATVVGKLVTISKALIRSELLFDDANGIDTLNNQAVFDNIQLMGPSPSTFIPDPNPVTSSGNHGEIKDLKAHIKQLKNKARPVINHHKAWFMASRKVVKSSKGAPSVATHPDWDDLEDTLDEAMDYTLAQDEGKTNKVGKKGGSTKSTAQLQCTDKQTEGTADQNEGNRATSTAPIITSTPTPTIFGDDETIAQVLIIMSQNKQKEKEKGVELRNVEDIERPRPTSTRLLLTLKPLPKIDPKDKGKKMIDKEGSAKDERLIKEMNKKAAGMDKEEVAKEPENNKIKGLKENIRKISGRRLKMKAPKRSKRQKTDSDDEKDNQLRNFLKIVPDEEEKMDYEVLGTRYPIIVWESKFYDYGHYGRELIYYRVFRAYGSSRWIKTFSETIKLFDRMDLIEVHSLVMKRFETISPEGIDLLLWGDLRTMFESKEDDELWKNQEE